MNGRSDNTDVITLHDLDRHLGNTFDNLWLLGVVAISLGVSLTALQRFGLLGLVALPASLLVFGLLASGLYSCTQKRTVRFTPAATQIGAKNDVAAVVVNKNGWAQCPACNKSFVSSDPRVWDGEQHNCGQRIDLEEAGQ